MEGDNTAPLLLGLLAITMFVFSLGVILVPVWSPEVIPVLMSLAATLSLFAVIVSLRNAYRRREFFWMLLLVLFGPVAVLGYGLLKATESGELASYLDRLSHSTVEDRDSREG